MPRLCGGSISRLLLLAIVFVLFFGGDRSSRLGAQETEADLARQQAVVDRFLTVLEKNPRRGTALDRIYGFHVENGSLEAFVKRFTDRVAADPKDGVGWMILGLLEAQRGHDAAAATAFAEAVQTRPTDPLPAYYLGQSLVLTGQPDKAVAALEQAIARKPAQSDLLEIFQTLGRIHQRAQRTEEALAVWSRLEKLFPNDPRVQEQIAVTLVEEGHAALALPRYEALIKITKDDYRKSVYRMDAAELKVKLSRSTEAITDLETLLAGLNPTSWLHREVRRKIEEIFLRTDDQEGLAKYYERWVGKHPEDVDAIARLARVLARQARVPEAQTWLDKAIKLAPSRKELRLAFIEQLIDDQRFTEAVAQYALLDKAEPNNPDYLREWGKLILRDVSQPKDVRQKQAEQVWRRLIAARPKDPLVATQAADLFRHAELTQPALELYQQAVALAPDQPQYREYLGEFYHQLKRNDEALATWRQIAAGKQRTAVNVARLAEVLASFGYLEEAVPEMQAACKLDPKDFSLQMKAADLLAKGQKFANAESALAAAGKLVQNDEEAELVLAAQMGLYQLDGSFDRRTKELADAVMANPTDAKQLYLLARYHEAQRMLPLATEAITTLLKLTPRSLPALATAARIYEQAGDFGKAAEHYRTLATADRRGRGDYLKRVAQLEQQLGRADEALAAGRELIASAPGNSENYEFYADMCARLGRGDEGLTTLRRALRLNPNEGNLLLKLATTLAEQFRTDEAIELYWQAFDKAGGLDEKLAVVPKLTDLYLQTNHLDRLLERLERQRRDADDKREMTICLAQAYHSASDYGMARQELESLFTDNTRDTQLLQQLSKLAETEGDLTDAVKYQERLAKLAPGPEAEYRLATLLAQNGATQESAVIMIRLATREEDLEKLLRNIDSLLATDQNEMALRIIETKLREEPGNWELLYREAVALDKQPAEASRRFEAILSLPLEDDVIGIVEKNRRAKVAKATASGTITLVRGAGFNLYRLDSSYEVMSVTGLANEDDGYRNRSQGVWSPRDYSQARLAAIGWLMRYARDAGEAAELELRKRFTTPVSQPKPAPRQLWDYLRFASLDTSSESNPDDAERKALYHNACRQLAVQGDRAGQYLFVISLRRDADPRSRRANAADKLPPVPPADLELALECYQALRKVQNAPLTQLTTIVLTELKRSGREPEADKIFHEIVDHAQQPAEIQQAIMLNVQRDDVPATLALFQKWRQLVLTDPRYSTANVGSMANFLCELIGTRGAAKQDAEVLAIVDAYLDYNRERANQQRQKQAKRSSTLMRSGNYYTIYNGKSRQNSHFDFPTPGDYFDSGALQVLRNAFETFRRHDVLSDLERHLAERLAKAPNADKLYEHLALGYLQFWNENTEGAVEQLTAASQLAPQDVPLRLEIAQFQLQLQNLTEALALVDSVAPQAQEMVRAKETAALGLAARLGDHDRARQAAERLFGLRLDAESQMQLVEQMRRLGMHEQADAVLARAQKQSGNRLSSMLTLMNAYQTSGKSEMAVQIAHQILRRSRANSNASANIPGRASDDSARRSALQVMNSAGKLKEMIAETEQQLERSPGSAQLYLTLAEYCSASGDQAGALQWQGKLVEARGDDAALRLSFAQQLSELGKFDEACEQYKLAIKKQPRSIQNNLDDAYRTFQQAKKPQELVDLLSQVDLKQVGHHYYVMNIVSNMLDETETRPAALVLLRRAWEAFPDQRLSMLTNFYSDEIWDLPEIYAFGKEALLPNKYMVERDPWLGISEIRSYSGDGTINTTFGSVLKTAIKTNRLAELREELQAASAKFPQWQAGPMMVAVLDARLGKHDAARTTIEKALAADPPLPDNACWIVGLELEAEDPLRDVVIKLYETACASTEESSMARRFEYGVGQRLVNMYVAAGRKDAARQVLANAEKQKEEEEYDPAYAIEQAISNKIRIAHAYDELELPIEALRLYRQALSSTSGANSPVGNAAHYAREAQQHLDRLLKKVMKSGDPLIAREFLKPREASTSGPAIDLLLSLTPDSEGSTRLNSQLFTLLSTSKLTPAAQQAIVAELKQLAAAQPRDLSIATLQAAWAMHFKLADRQTLVERLLALTAADPLEPLAAGQRANARQREAARQRLALWLVARPCLADDSTKAAGEALASIALEGARRQTDTTYSVAMLMESSKEAFRLGDKTTGERQLKQLLEVALARPKLTKPAANPAIPPVTLSQFEQGMTIAQLALEQGLPKLAMEAVREALRGGLPVTDIVATPSRSRMTVRGMLGQVEHENESVLNTVGSRLLQVSREWRERSLPPSEMYELLREVVLPSRRAGEVLVFETEINDWTRPQCLGWELVQWSLAAQRTAELSQEVSVRGEQPPAKSAAAVMKVFLAVATGQVEAAHEPLRALQPTAEEEKNPLRPRNKRSHLAHYAAAIAFQVPELQADALPVLRHAASYSEESDNLADPLVLVSRYHLQKQDLAGLRECYREFLQRRQSVYSASDPEYSTYLQLHDLARMINYVAMTGDAVFTMEYLGRILDMPISEHRREFSVAIPLWHLAWQLQALEATQRYEALREWTLPTKTRRTLRFASALSSGHQLAEPFIPAHLAKLGPAPGPGPLNTFALLVSAAREAGQLDALRTAASAAVAKKLPHAKLLSTMVAIERKEPGARQEYEALANGVREAIKNPPHEVQQIPAEYRWEEIAVLEAGFASPVTRDIAQRLAPIVLKQARDQDGFERVTYLTRMIGLDALRDLPDAERERLLSPGLRWWHPATPPTLSDNANVPAWWTAHDRHISHITGFDYDSLFFKYPLTGTFEFSFEAHGYDFSQGQLAYGGLISIPEFWNNSIDVMPIARNEVVNRAAALDAGEWWNRYSVRVSPEAIRFYANGHLVYEDLSPSPTSPWLHLVSLEHRRTDFRNLKLSGDVKIPRQVSLSQGDRLDGWRTPFGESLPVRISKQEPKQDEEESDDPFSNRISFGPRRYLNHSQGNDQPHWTSSEGVITGRREMVVQGESQACLAYHRPLMSGETLSYEFYYEPGQKHVHPALGRLALMLEPAGVRLHWLAHPFGGANLIELPSANVIDQPQFRRGPAQLPLKTGDWNAISIRLDKDVLKLTLNGTVIFERPLEASNSREFGLFHYRDQTAAQVRNVVLTGDWPTEISEAERQQLTALETPDEPLPLRRARQALVREEELADEAYAVWSAAQALDAKERYAQLKGWVLPSESRATFRLQTEFSPIDQPAPAIAAKLAMLTGRRRHVGGELVSPAHALVATAAELGQLDALEQGLTKVASDVLDAQRNTIALQAMIAMTRGDDASAKALLARSLELLKALPGDTPAWRRHAELNSVLMALERSTLRAAALPLAELLVENQHANYQSPDWERRVRWLRAKARWLNDPVTVNLPFGETTSKLTQWQAVSHPTAEQRGRGIPAPTWRYEPGKAAFCTGHGDDSLYFQSPLIGDFEVHCRRTTYGWKEIRPQYAAVSIDLHHEGQAIFRHQMARGGVEQPLNAKLPKWGEEVDYRLVVKNGYYTVFINDTLVHTERLKANFDPWLTIQSDSPHFNGSVENVRIIGSPTIPEKLDLSLAPDISAWRAEYYGEAVDFEDATWHKQKGEIVGEQVKNAPHSQRESVLRYHRPLLEDGELTYEFYYEPGQIEVHPALDRAALLLSADGVRLHFLTDGAFERSGTTAGNATALAGAKPVPLKPQAWNTALLKLVGDEVTLSINGEEVAKYTLEATNQRIFGFFRYSDATSTRIRNVVYRGNWPRTLPSVEEQQLASPK